VNGRIQTNDGEICCQNLAGEVMLLSSDMKAEQLLPFPNVDFQMPKLFASFNVQVSLNLLWPCLRCQRRCPAARMVNCYMYMT